MKKAEFEALVNSASSSNSNNSTSSGSSNRANVSSAKRRGGFPPITREGRSRTRRWLLLLILILILLFLGWRILIRPWLFPLSTRPPETMTRPPAIFIPLNETTSISTTSQPEQTTQKTTKETEVPWPGLPAKIENSEFGQNDESSSLESKFKIEAELEVSNENGESELKEQIQGVVTGFYTHLDQKSTSNPTTITSNGFNYISTTTEVGIDSGSKDVDSDYEDENRIWFPRRLASIETTTPKLLTTTLSRLTTRKKTDGSRIVHPHANAGAGLPTQKPINEVDLELKDLISQLENDVPAWKIEPKGMPPVTAPPLPADATKKVKFPSFSVHASVQTMLDTKQYDRKHKIDKRSDTPVIVTGLLNIGRGDWIRFTRPYDIYLDCLMDLLQLDNRFIIFCDEEAQIFLSKQPELDWDRIQLIRITLKDLPFYRYRDEISRILDYEQKNWNKTWDSRFRDHPEALFPDYDILVNSKPYLMHNATQISRFETDFYVWIDAGYSHGSKTLIPRGLWDPELKSGKITVIKITPELDKPERYALEMVYRKRWDVISGGFLAGDVATIRRFSVFFFKTFMALLDQGRVDDDQTVLLMTIKNYASTFNLLIGGWFDAFNLVPGRS